MAFCLSCENRHETNGEFAGMWQMTQWRQNETGKILATQADGIYYCVQLSLMKFQFAGHVNDYYLAQFTHTKDSLIINKVYNYPADTICPISVLSKYAVPDDGKFHIEILNSSNMVLSSKESTLTFRKY